jgi:hypothetical protein
VESRALKLPLIVLGEQQVTRLYLSRHNNSTQLGTGWLVPSQSALLQETDMAGQKKPDLQILFQGQKKV